MYNSTIWFPAKESVSSQSSFLESCFLNRDRNLHSDFCKAALCRCLLCYTNKSELDCIMVGALQCFHFIFLIYKPCRIKLYWHPFFINVALYQSLFDIQGYSRHNCTFHWYTVTLSAHHRSNAIVQLDEMRQFPWQTRFQTAGVTHAIYSRKRSIWETLQKKLVCSSRSDLRVLTCQ